MAPWIVFLIAVVVLVFLRALGRALAVRLLRRFAQSRSLFCGSVPSGRISLVAIYMSQEFLEGLLATSHPGGLTGIFGFGGWWSVPAAAAVGFALAAVFYGARWAPHEVAERYRRAPWCLSVRRRPSHGARAMRSQSPGWLHLWPGWSRRGPPCASVRC